MESRVIIRIEVLESAVDGIQNVTEQYGMTQVAVQSRLIEWFFQQSEFIQAGILGILPRHTEIDIPAMAIKHMRDQAR